MSSDSEDQIAEDSNQDQYEEEEEVQERKINKNKKKQEDSDEDEEDDDGEQQRLEEEEKLIKEQLKHASYETIMKIKAKQKQIEMQKMQFQSTRKSRSADGKSFQNKTELMQDKRSNKQAPLERSAKKPVSVLQTVISSKKQKGRDPRFDGLSGEFNSTYYNNSYSFIDEMKKKEIEILSQDVKKKKFSTEEKQVLKKELGKIKSELKQKEHNDRKREVADKYKSNAKQSIKSGHLPYFAKKNQMKDDVLRIQYEKLDSQGKLDKLLKRKRKQQSDKLMAAYSLITHKKIKKD